MLLARRLWGREIALALGIRLRTAEHHVAAALGKLRLKRSALSVGFVSAGLPANLPTCVPADWLGGAEAYAVGWQPQA